MTLLSIAIITAGIVAAAVVRWLGMSRVRRLWTWVGRRAAWFAGAAGAAVGVLAVWAWFIRPSAQATTTNNEFVQAWIAAHQERQGLPIEPARTYYESSLRWIGYYFGPVVVGAAVAGWAILAVRIARRRWLQALPFLFCFSAITGLYLWDPSIAPDHAWAMRRFLPLTLPGFVLLAVVAVDRVFDLDISPRVRNAGRAAAVLVVGAALAFSIRTQLGVFTERTQDGMLGATQGLCDELGNRAAVLSLGGPGMHQYVAAVRSFCDVPVVTLPPESERGTVGEIARAWAARGRRLYVVDTDADSVRAAVPPGVDVTEFTVTGEHFLEERLQGRPTDLVEETFTVAVAPAHPTTAG